MPDPYESEISFTLDVICPWTYLAKKRLDEALHRFRNTSPSTHLVSFTFRYHPYQLYPSFPVEGEDKYAWYMREKHDSSPEKMAMYAVAMEDEGRKSGINFKFGGKMSNTFEAHRLIQWAQEEKGPQVADGVVRSLYRQYFEEEMTPNAEETLMKAASEAGVGEEEARMVVVEDKSQFSMDTKMAMREQVGNGVDSVPYVVFEGKRRDLTLIGAKGVEEYVKTLEMIAKESQ